jgi:hypothetical protein
MFDKIDPTRDDWTTANSHCPISSEHDGESQTHLDQRQNSNDQFDGVAQSGVQQPAQGLAHTQRRFFRCEPEQTSCRRKQTVHGKELV